MRQSPFRSPSSQRRRTFSSPTICLLSIVTLSALATCVLATPVPWQVSAPDSISLSMPNTLDDTFSVHRDAESESRLGASEEQGWDYRLHPLCNVRLGGRTYDLCPLMKAESVRINRSFFLSAMVLSEVANVCRIRMVDPRNDR